jgi:hypothetical protein
MNVETSVACNNSSGSLTGVRWVSERSSYSSTYLEQLVGTDRQRGNNKLDTVRCDCLGERDEERTHGGGVDPGHVGEVENDQAAR